jgi:hypothetical protein
MLPFFKIDEGTEIVGRRSLGIVSDTSPYLSTCQRLTSIMVARFNTESAAPATYPHPRNLIHPPRVPENSRDQQAADARAGEQRSRHLNRAL